MWCRHGEFGLFKYVVTLPLMLFVCIVVDAIYGKLVCLILYVRFKSIATLDCIVQFLLTHIFNLSWQFSCLWYCFNMPVIIKLTVIEHFCIILLLVLKHWTYLYRVIWANHLHDIFVILFQFSCVFAIVN